MCACVCVALRLSMCVSTCTCTCMLVDYWLAEDKRPHVFFICPVNILLAERSRDERCTLLIGIL